MLSIQIDTKSLERVIYHQFNNIKLPFFASHMKSIFHYVCLIDAVRLLDTLGWDGQHSSSDKCTFLPFYSAKFLCFIVALARTRRMTHFRVTHSVLPILLSGKDMTKK